ncbi:MAG TPA: hypothetical protein VM390_00355 [Acidimicrobiales bacterium]|jgi:hypothetical protein|nr:hypothetical protein [Acidimicrobiales bacterium]
MTAPTTGPRVTRAEIEAKLRQVRGDVDTAGEAAKGAGSLVGALAVVAIVVVAFALGRKRGKRSSTVVEVRRF